MANRHIQYRSGYKYQTTEQHQVVVGIHPPEDIKTDYIRLKTDGTLTIEKGYAWDGPSGPTFDTSNFMRGSLIHDALYQLMRHEKLDGARWRRTADDELKRLCREDCMSRLRAWYVHRAVVKAGGFAASPESRKPIHQAPRRTCGG